MTNLNGTLKARSDGSVRVLVLRPGGGGPNNPLVCRRVASPELRWEIASKKMSFLDGNYLPWWAPGCRVRHGAFSRRQLALVLDLTPLRMLGIVDGGSVIVCDSLPKSYPLPVVL